MSSTTVTVASTSVLTAGWSRKVPRTAATLAFLVYLVVAMVMLARVWRHPFGLAMGHGDGQLFEWWLEWTPRALLHGHNPLTTDYLNLPTGVNGMWNTGVYVLAVLAAPITLAAGPVFTFNLLLTLGPAVSGLAFFLVLRRYVQRPWTAFVGGLMFAFAPFQAAHLLGHLNLVWSFLPPLLLLFADEVFVRQRYRPWRLGCVFGLLLAAQFGISSEMLAVGIVALGLTGVVVAARWPDHIRSHLPYVARVATGTVASFLLLCGYPLYVMLYGPAVPRHEVRDPHYFVADLANLVIPGAPTAVGWTDVGGRLLRTNDFERGLYLGPLLVLLPLIVITTRRTIARLTAAVGLACLVAALGPGLVVFNTPRSVWLPWDAFLSVPMLGDIMTVRFTLYVGFCAAILVTVWLDWLAGRVRAPGQVRLWPVAGLVVAAVAVATLAPNPNAYRPSPQSTPAFFANNMLAGRVPDGGVVKTVPWGTADFARGGLPMLWQARTHMAYRTTGGYFIGADSTHPLLYQGVPDSFDLAVSAAARASHVDPAARRAAAERLGELRVCAIVLVPEAGRPVTSQVAFVRSLTGRAGTWIGGVWFWRLDC